jgi:hypothetical protein
MLKTGPKKATKRVESLVSVKTVDGSLLRGKIYLGEEKRVSDIFSKSKSPFVVLYDVTSQSAESKVMIVNKEHIVWVEPEENADG